MTTEEQITSSDDEIQEIQTPVRKSLDDMTFEELKAYSKNKKQKAKQYISKYQKTEQGKKTTRVASQKYYTKKRALILEKKREYYQRKKAAKLKA
tara:strand:- start:886 stop:1170 length:285 start_codon:yes stop_codon:yes gene_type:complete